MADGYARLRGRPAFVYGAYGPGAANLSGSLAEPFWSGSPVVALTSTMRRADRFRREYQELDQLPLFASVTKWGAEASAPTQVPRLVREAARHALMGTPGPGLPWHPERPVRDADARLRPTPSAAPRRSSCRSPAPPRRPRTPRRSSGLSLSSAAGRSSWPATASTSRAPTTPFARFAERLADPGRHEQRGQGQHRRDARARPGQRRALLAQLRQRRAARRGRRPRDRDQPRRPRHRLVQARRPRGAALPRERRSRGPRAELPDRARHRRGRPDVPRGRARRRRPAGGAARRPPRRCTSRTWPTSAPPGASSGPSSRPRDGSDGRRDATRGGDGRDRGADGRRRGDRRRYRLCGGVGRCACRDPAGRPPVPPRRRVARLGVPGRRSEPSWQRPTSR